MLHGQEVAAVDLAEVVDLDDVRVVEEGADARLVDEHLDELRSRALLLEDALDDEDALEPLQPVRHRPVDLRHPSPADELEQDVSPETLTHCLWRESRHRCSPVHRRGKGGH